MWAASSRKRLFDSILLKKQRKSSRCVLLSSITMKCKIFRLAAFLISISKCGSNQVGTGVTRYSVTYDPAGIEIQNDAEIYTNSFFSDLGIYEDNIKRYNVVSFSEFYNEKVRTAPQNEKINNFTYTVQRDLNKYSEQIKLFCNEFKQCY